MHTIYKGICLSLIAAFTPALMATELSLVSGLYSSEKDKSDGEDAGGKTEIKAGARFAEKLSEQADWFVKPLIILRSYDSAKGQKDPSDSTSLHLFGGVRWNFREFSQAVTPFVSGQAGFVQDKTASPSSNTETEHNGVFYGGSAGFRFNVAKDFFFDIETTLFNSALFATEKTKAIDDTDANAPKDSEKKETELYADSFGDISSTTIGVGMKF